MAATALPLAAGTAGAAGVGFDRSVPLYAVIYDERFEASVAFARRARQLGLATRAIAGDMTSVWYHDLYHRWKHEPVAIAGMTGHGALFCFDHLARDQRMRVVFEAEHRPAAAGVVRHSMQGPATMLSAGLEPGRTPAALGRSMAELVATCPEGLAEVRQAEFSCQASLPLGRGERALYSWVIAPSARA